MTDNDDPFGRRDRTIIRPNPGRRLPTSPLDPSPRLPPVPPAAPVKAPTQRSKTEVEPTDRRPAPTPPAPAPTAPPPSPRVSSERIVGVGDPIMSAGASLLLLLGRLRASLSRAVANEMTGQIARAIEQFEIDVRAAGVPTAEAAAAKYALAATADDIVLNLPRLDNAGTAPFSMLSRMFNERPGGARFFQEVERAKHNPSVNLGLLELMHACLSLGFEGKYRAKGGAAGLQNERRDLFEAIRASRPAPASELSPHWRGQTIALAGNRFEAPVWSVAAIALAILFAAYLFLRETLSARAGALAMELARVHPETQIAIARPEPVKPPVAAPISASVQLQRIRSALADEMMAKAVDVSQTGTRITITLSNRSLFPAGAAKVAESFAPVVMKIAKLLDKEPGAIQINAYTDNVPIKTLAFPSNFELSEARAKSVAVLFKPNLARPDRLQVAGRGEANPVAANDVEANRSKNRRVEVSIARAE